jgi:predicted ATP-grasp superfamily ATP-dependent carboligase
MKILVFEFATATGSNDPSFIAEGHAMLYGLLEDLKDFKTYYLISNDSQIMNTPSIPVTVNGDLGEWLRKNIQNYDACLPIAPEENNIMLDLTLIIEKQGVTVLGSSSNAVKLTTNKFETYNVLKDKFPIIKTKKVYFKDLNKKSDENGEYYKSHIKNGLSTVVKPADGVSCSGVKVVNSLNEFITAKDHIQMLTQLPYCIVQDYVNGVSVSVSLLCNGDQAVPLSLNFQDISLNSGEIKYGGGMVPLKHRLSEIAMETAKNVIESIGGIKGYVGVDMILDEDSNGVHIVEINSRITTAYVALRKIINFNLGEAILKSVQGNLPDEITLNGTINFYKEGKTLRISVLK